MITRTIPTTNAVVMVVWNDDSNSIGHMPFTFGDKLDEKQVEKAVRRQLDDSKSAFFVRVESVDHSEKLYGIEESAFLANAVELDPVTRKPIEDTFTLN